MDEGVWEFYGVWGGVADFFGGGCWHCPHAFCVFEEFVFCDGWFSLVRVGAFEILLGEDEDVFVGVSEGGVTW